MIASTSEARPATKRIRQIGSGSIDFRVPDRALLDRDDQEQRGRYQATATAGSPAPRAASHAVLVTQRPQSRRVPRAARQGGRLAPGA
jgi:hypothetical protein